MVDACRCVHVEFCICAVTTHYSILSMSIYKVVSYVAICIKLDKTIIAILSDARSDDHHDFM